MKILALAVTIIALASPVAQAARSETPEQAFAQVRACMLNHGATHVQHKTRGSGIAWFQGSYKWVSWSFVLQDNRVVGVSMIRTLNGRQGTLAVACLAPYRR